MTTWKLLPAGPSPGGQFADGTPPGITVACGFVVTADGCTATGVWFRATDTIDAGTTYTIELWQYGAGSTNTGTRLAVRAFDDSEVTPGVWQTLPFTTPVALSQSERYAASINYGNAGTVRYCATAGGFTTDQVQGPLTGYADNTTVLGVAAMRNNVFRDGSAPGTGSFPGNAFGSPSYSISPVIDDGASVSGDAEFGLDLALDAEGGKLAAGGAAFGLNLELDGVGRKRGTAAAALGINLQLTAAGRKIGRGAAAFGFNLALTAGSVIVNRPARLVARARSNALTARGTGDALTARGGYDA